MTNDQMSISIWCCSYLNSDYFLGDLRQQRDDIFNTSKSIDLLGGLISRVFHLSARWTLPLPPLVLPPLARARAWGRARASGGRRLPSGSPRWSWAGCWPLHHPRPHLRLTHFRTQSRPVSNWQPLLRLQRHPADLGGKTLKNETRFIDWLSRLSN